MSHFLGSVKSNTRFSNSPVRTHICAIDNQYLSTGSAERIDAIRTKKKKLSNYLFQLVLYRATRQYYAK